MKIKLLITTLVITALIVFFYADDERPVDSNTALTRPIEQELNAEDHIQLKSIQKQKVIAEKLKEAYSDQNTAAQNALEHYQQAVAEREAAEAQLQTLELEVEQLENEVDLIEQRGDDPVDFQDDSLASFQTMFGRFQDAMQRLDAAEAAEAESLRLLELNKQGLEALPE